MFVPRSFVVRSAVALVAALTSLGLTACGTSGSPSSSPSSPASPSSGALPLEQRVTAGDLAGLTSPAGVQTAKSADEYAKLVDPDDADDPDPDLAEKRKQDTDRAAEAGLVGAAVKNYGTTDAGWGVSVAAQLGSPEQAKAYEQKLYDEEFADDLPADAEKGTIPGTAASHTLLASAEDAGEVNTLALASFVDGPFVYVLSAGGTNPAVTKESAKSVIDQAKALYLKVKDRPAT